MELAALSDRHGALYVPAFRILVAGRDVLREELIAVSQVEVDIGLDKAGRFSFTVVDGYNLQKHEFLSGTGKKLLDVLTFGASVEIGMGYGDTRRLPTLMTGLITEITTGFSEGGSPELTVSGSDHAFPMTVGKNSRSWSAIKDSDVVHLIASSNNLLPDIETTKEQHAQIEQNQESDLEFIKKLADRNHFTFYVTDRILRFGSPRDKGDGVVTLLWGEGLLSFRPEANLAAQVAAVEVYSWDPNTKETIVGRAEAGGEAGRDPRRQSAGDRLSGIIHNRPVLRLRQPVFTQAEADSRARAILNERAKEFLTGEGECMGLPELRPDRNITLGNLGALFSKTYYLEQTTHKLDGSGYRTRFKVKETTL